MQDLEDIIIQIPASFSPEAKVWVYHSNRPMSLEEQQSLKLELGEFQKNWDSHGSPVHSWVKIIDGNGVIIIGEPQNGDVSGCSTDSMVHQMKKIGEKLNLDFFSPQILLIYHKGKFERVPYNQLQYAVNNGLVHMEDLFLDPSVSTVEELRHKYILPIGQSWLINRIKLN